MLYIIRQIEEDGIYLILASGVLPNL